jgi:hypothetical protein
MIFKPLYNQIHYVYYGSLEFIILVRYIYSPHIGAGIAQLV